MKKEYDLSEAKVVFTKDELGYQEVIDSFDTAKEIVILTYNISGKNKSLIERLRNAPEDCKISIISNIPGRFDQYYGSEYREKIHKRINFYMNRLDPEKFCNAVTEIWFNFSNHGKIIMTDSVAYIGSSNYSEESSKNFEAGVIFRDSRFIDFWNTEIMPMLEADNISYYEDYSVDLIEANMVAVGLIDARNKLFEETYNVYDEKEHDRHYTDYIFSESQLQEETLWQIENAANTSVDIACDLGRMAVGILDRCAESKQIGQAYQSLKAQARSIIELTKNNTLRETAGFNAAQYIDTQMQYEYAQEAFDSERVDECMEEAMSEAYSKAYELAGAAQEYVDGILDKMDQYWMDYISYIGMFESTVSKVVNPMIDNT